MDKVLEFYLFLGVDHLHTERIARKIGKKLELQQRVENYKHKYPIYIETNTLSYILEHYPSLYFDDRCTEYKKHEHFINDINKYVSYLNRDKNLTFFDYCKYGNISLVRKLSKVLCNNLDIKYKHYYSTGIFPILIEQEGIGLELNVQIDMGLLIVVEYGHLNIVKYLCEKLNANIKVQNRRAISLAIEYGHLHILEYFYENGLKFKLNNVILAIKYNRLEILKFILNHSKILQTDNILFGAIEAGNMEIIKYLCESCKVNIKYEDFLQACTDNKLEIVKYFHKENKDICKGKNLPLVIAYYRKHYKLIDYLKKMGIKYDFANDKHFTMWETFE